MSIAEKLTTIAENTPKVYDSGYSKGTAEGQKAEYDRFWDLYQENGARASYEYGFAGSGWTDETYNPKHKVVCTSNASYAYWYSGITTTKYPIEVRGCSATSMFRGCANLKTIPYLGFFGVTNSSTFFTACTNLESITFDGAIETGIGFAPCPKLTDETVANVIEHLADLTGKTSALVTFHANILSKLTEEQLAEIKAKNWEVR